VAGSGQARDYLAAFIARHQVKSAIYWSHPLLERLQLSQLLAQAGARAVCWWPQAPQAPDAARDAALTAEWGITSVNWAVAETGTLALGARAQQGRLVSLLPPKYLAIVEAAQILPDLFDLFAALEPARHDLPSNLALVTGPSKTGDIELKLTTGVHGPGEVHLLVIDPEPCLP
jgi:L-lactate utilization protein LutC